MSETTLSFEFFPPRSEDGRQKLYATRKQLSQFNPEFFSCTFGAGGSTREGTFQTVSDIVNDGLEAAPHLACIGANRSELKKILDDYVAIGVKRVVALRGDMPSGMGLMEENALQYASQLVGFIREIYGNHFHIEVAA